jgi:hypothetical protein
MSFSYHCFILLLFALVLLLFFDHPLFVTSTLKILNDNVTGSGRIEIIKIPFNNTDLSSLAIDPISDLVYVSGSPGYPYNHSSTSCVDQITNSSNASGFVFPCSAIYILNGSNNQINNIIRLRPGEIIHDMDINPLLGEIYAAL